MWRDKENGTKIYKAINYQDIMPAHQIHMHTCAHADTACISAVDVAGPADEEQELLVPQRTFYIVPD